MLSPAQERSVPVRRWRPGDALVGALVVLVGWVPATLAQPHAGLRALGLVLGALVAATVALRWRCPVPAAASVAAATVVASALGLSDDPFLAAAWALYPVAVLHGHRAGAVPLAVVVAVGAVAAVTGVPGATASAGLVRAALVAVVALSASWVLGTAVGRQVAASAEAERARARERIDQVQVHTAREVHDVVAHTLGTIGAEAGVSRVLADADEHELREALARIEGSSRRGLEQVQVLLRALRPAAGAAPAPGLADLPALVERARAAGLDATLVRRGTAEVGARTGAVVHRVVQEGLTNAVRHAPGARCEVVVTTTRDGVRVAVTDDGPGMPAGAVEGFGLTGLRERVALAGGTARVERRPGGGLAVTATLPHEGAAP